MSLLLFEIMQSFWYFLIFVSEFHPVIFLNVSLLQEHLIVDVEDESQNFS